MFGLKNFINWSSIFFIAISIYFSFSFYNYQMFNENFLFEGNAIVLFIFMIYLLNNLPQNENSFIRFGFSVVFSIIFLTLNTYLIIPITLAFLFYFRNNLYMIFGGLILVAASAYAINTFIITSDKINITLETLRVIPVYILVLFVFFNFYLGWIITDKQELIFTSGLMIFILLLIAWIYDSPIQNRFLLTIPFFLFSLKKYNVDRFLGKVYNN